MTTTLANVLNEALADECKARDTYQAIINRYGPVRPFVNIVEAEQTHINALLPLFAKYGVAVPPEPDLAGITTPDSLLDACGTSVAIRSISSSGESDSSVVPSDCGLDRW